MWWCRSIFLEETKMDAKDFYEQTRHQLAEAMTVMKAYGLGEELSASQLTKLWLDASRLTKALHEAKLAAQGQEWGE